MRNEIGIKKETKGFTLIELLTVGAILVILVGLLIPVVSASRRSAKRTECKHRLRRIGVAFHMYSLANDGYFPHEDAGSSGSFPIEHCWFELLDPYLGNGDPRKTKQCPTFADDLRWHSYKMNSKLEDGADPFYQVGSSGDESNTVLLFDGRTDSKGNRYQTKGTWYSAEVRHRNKTQLLFVDGKVAEHQPELREIGGWAKKGPFIWSWK